MLGKVRPGRSLSTYNLSTSQRSDALKYRMRDYLANYRVRDLLADYYGGRIVYLVAVTLGYYFGHEQLHSLPVVFIVGILIWMFWKELKCVFNWLKRRTVDTR